MALAALLGLWAFWLEPNRLTIKRVAVPLPGWPAGRPLRVAVLSDIHGGAPHINAKKMKAIVQLTNRQNPGLIVLLGDYVILGVLGGNFMEPEMVAKNLAAFSAPLGVYAVLGNHDWWHDGLRIRKSLEGVGYRVLENEISTVTFEGKTVYLAGLADEWTRRPDVENVLNRIPSRAATVVLTHGPDLFPRIPPINGVTLAAHTHDGQVCLPLMGAPIVPSRYRQR